MFHLSRAAVRYIPVLIADLIAVLALGACAGHMGGVTTAETVMRDEAIQRQQAEQAPTVPDNRKVYLSLITDMQAKGLYYASLAHVNAFIKKYGPDDDILLLRADALRETGQYEAALAVYQPLTTGRNSARAQHGIGRVLAAEHRWPEAIDALSAAVSGDPVNVSYLNDLAYADMASGQIDAARTPMAQASELGATNRKVIANLVLYLYMVGDETRAAQVIVQSKMPPETVSATRSLALRLARPSEAHQAPVMSAPGVTEPIKMEPVAKDSGTAVIGWPTTSMLERFGASQ